MKDESKIELIKTTDTIDMIEVEKRGNQGSCAKYWSRHATFPWFHSLRKQMIVTHTSSNAEKIQLFRSLFVGRDDVFARRFENVKKGTSGYSPCCENRVNLEMQHESVLHF